MKIAIPTETQAGESRVAASPDSVKAYVKKGVEVVIGVLQDQQRPMASLSHRRLISSPAPGAG